MIDFARSYILKIPFLLYGVLLFSIGIAAYLLGVATVVPRYLFGLNAVLLGPTEWIVWHSGMPVFAGAILALFDVLILLPFKRDPRPLAYDVFDVPKVTVVLTAYNDEASIGPSVADFLAHPRVGCVIVVSNNSRDATFENAQKAGAITFNELAPGYGRCVWRSLSEAVRHDRSGLIVLCEGDCTFRAFDIDKLLAYAPHADIVNGTRTVEKLRQFTTQLSTFMYYGNVFVGKLLEAKHLGRGTVTDVGTTYKLCRVAALERLLPQLDASINLEFNAYLLDTALGMGLRVVECPITFHPRVGVSKGGNTNDARALKVGVRMIFGIVFGWRWFKS